MADTQQNTEPKKPKKPQVAKDSDAPKVKKPRERSDYKQDKTVIVRVDRRFTHATDEEDRAALKEVSRTRREQRVFGRRHGMDSGRAAPFPSSSAGP